MPRTKKTLVETPEIKKEISKATFYQAVGRRKESTARVRLIVGGESKITVNNRPVENYFPGEMNRLTYLQPLSLADSLNRFEISVLVSGGGPMGQLDAMIHGISRALLKVDKEKYRPVLKKAGLLKRDPRAKQRRKAGYAGKSRAKKQSPKR